MEARVNDSSIMHKFWARAAAFFIFCVAAGVTICCIVYVEANYGSAWYDESKLIIGMATGTVALGCFVFLLCSSAHKEGCVGCVLLRQDKIPYDLYLICAAMLIVGLCAVLVDFLHDHAMEQSADNTKITVAVIMASCAAAPFMALCMTTAARIKTGTLFKNTVVYRLSAGICAGVRSTADSINSEWRFALAFAGYMAVNAVFAAMFFSPRSLFGFVMLMLINGGMFCFLLKLIKQMRVLLLAGRAMAAGDLSYIVDTSKMKRELREHGDDLNSIGRGMSIAVNERMKSERFKTELITNVSHDLKTPLTSIVTYIDLLQKENIQGERAAEYIETITRQSKKLKKLTEDLIDASKASSGAVNVNIERVNLSELLRQSAAEYGERMAEVNITPVMMLPEEDIYIRADGRLLWRVIENLLQNICRHGMPGTRAYLEARAEGGSAAVTLKNISERQLNIPVEELFERFVQGDEARSRGGSGLGLSIAQSLTELMKGEMRLALDGDLFKVELCFCADGGEG